MERITQDLGIFNCLTLIDFYFNSEDVLRADRVNGNPTEADTSNFLHPVLYYYRESPKTFCKL